MRSIVTVSAGALLLLFGLCGVSRGADEAAVVRESQLEAAYVFNFVKFVDWPPDISRSDLQICVRGAPRVYEAMRANVENKTIGARAVVIRSVQPGEQVDSCHALYVGGEPLRNGKLLAESEVALPLLTISDAQGFAQRDGIIELFTANNRLRFDINADNARRVGLRISAGLLQLASSVRTDGR